MPWLRSGRRWRARRWRWCVECRLSCPAGVGVSFLKHNKFAAVFQCVGRPPFPFSIKEKVESTRTRKLFPCHVVVIEWRSWPPLAILRGSISSGASISESTGLIPRVTIPGDTLGCITFIESCGNHLGSVISVIPVGSAPPSPVTTAVRFVLVSRIIFVVIFSRPCAIPTHGIFSFGPLVGDLHEVSNGGWTKASKFFL